MAFGDIGGAVTELVITCTTCSDGVVAIAKGDSLALVDNYTIDNIGVEGCPVFGQALASADRNSQAIPVKVKGVAIFSFNEFGVRAKVGGKVVCDTKGFVVPVNNGVGTIVKVDRAIGKLHVLL